MSHSITPQPRDRVAVTKLTPARPGRSRVYPCCPHCIAGAHGLTAGRHTVACVECARDPKSRTYVPRRRREETSA